MTECGPYGGRHIPSCSSYHKFVSLEVGVWAIAT
jgi:hypothetical protein